jgi:hypothetical protein
LKNIDFPVWVEEDVDLDNMSADEGGMLQISGGKLIG